MPRRLQLPHLRPRHPPAEARDIPVNLTARQLDVLRNLHWFARSAAQRGSSPRARPMDVGGRDGSHHSATLAQLVRKGLVKRTVRAAWASRGSFTYWITEEGRAVAGGARAKSAV